MYCTTVTGLNGKVVILLSVRYPPGERCRDLSGGSCAKHEHEQEEKKEEKAGKHKQLTTRQAAGSWSHRGQIGKNSLFYRPISPFWTVERHCLDPFVTLRLLLAGPHGHGPLEVPHARLAAVVVNSSQRWWSHCRNFRKSRHLALDRKLPGRPLRRRSEPALQHVLRRQKPHGRPGRRLGRGLLP